MIRAWASTCSEMSGIVGKTKKRAGKARLRTSGERGARRSTTSLFGSFVFIFRDAGSLFGGDRELVSVLIFEYCSGAPSLCFWLHYKAHALAFQQSRRSVHIVAPERDRLGTTDVTLLPVRGEKHQFGLAAGKPQLNPALFFIEWLVGENAEAELFSIEPESFLLIADRHGDKLDSTDHAILLLVEGEYGAAILKRKSGIDCYSGNHHSGDGTAMMLDDYVVDILMRDLVGHDHQPTSFLIYLWLSYETARSRRERVPVSYQTIADSVGVSKTAAQTSVRWLVRRKLIEVKRNSPTAVPTYRVLRPWLD